MNGSDNMLLSAVLCILGILSVYGAIFLIDSFFLRPSEKIPVVITCYNEENSIESDLRTLLFKNPKSEIIVIDLGSSDDTIEIVRKLSFSYPCIRLIKKNIEFDKK